MSDTTYTDIRAALSTRLTILPGLIDVAWENDHYDPTIDRPYLELTILWAESNQACIGAAAPNWERGIYQVSCHYPANEGPGRINAMAGVIKNHFKRGTTLTYNGIEVKVKKVYLGPPTSDDVSTIQPISIVFFCQAPN